MRRPFGVGRLYRLTVSGVTAIVVQNSKEQTRYNLKMKRTILLLLIVLSTGLLRTVRAQDVAVKTNLLSPRQAIGSATVLPDILSVPICWAVSTMPVTYTIHSTSSVPTSPYLPTTVIRGGLSEQDWLTATLG